jgi:hypothetical protein
VIGYAENCGNRRFTTEARRHREGLGRQDALGLRLVDPGSRTHKQLERKECDVAPSRHCVFAFIQHSAPPLFAAAAASIPRPSTRASGAHRGVPGLTLCLRCFSGSISRSAQCLTGQPPRNTSPVQLLPRRGRPPAFHRRGRSPLRSPPRDRADGATLARKARRPVLRDAIGKTRCRTGSRSPE